MKKVLLDANVIFDFLNESCEGHNTAKDVMAIIRNSFKYPYTTCTSFAIIYYLLGKKIKSSLRLNNIIKGFFLEFQFVKEDDTVMKQVWNSEFKDLEDGLQYYAAMGAGIDIIIKKNTFDFIKKDIPVLHPFEFVNYYDNL